MPHDPSSPVPDDAKTAIILAHEAGAATDTKWMDTMSAALSERSFRVVRFEFNYVSARRSSGKRSPPRRAEVLMNEFEAVIDELGLGRTVIVGNAHLTGSFRPRFQMVHDRPRLTVSGLPGRQPILRPNRAGKARVTA